MEEKLRGLSGAKDRPAYVSPTVWSLDSDAVREMLGPAESQYVMTTVAESCLPVLASNTVQDNWHLPIVGNPTRVRIDLDVVYDNSQCGIADNCGTAPAPSASNVDPKFALYPPGVAPAVGPFNGYVSAECGNAVTGETGCLTKPVDGCIVCDNTNCTLGSALPGTCGTLDVDLSPAGMWTIAVAPQAPAFVAEGQGCYVLTVTDLSGTGIGQLALSSNDATVTFLKTGLQKFDDDNPLPD